VSLRVVLAVALSLAILGLAFPAIEDAERRHTDRLVRGEVGEVVDEGRSLVGRDEVPPSGRPGPRRVVEVSIPERSLGVAGLEYLSFGGSPGARWARPTGGKGVVAYRLEDGPERRHRVPVPLTAAGDRPLVLREARSHRLLVRLRGDPDGRVVTVSRTGNRSTVDPGVQMRSVGHRSP